MLPSPASALSAQQHHSAVLVLGFYQVGDSLFLDFLRPIFLEIFALRFQIPDFIKTSSPDPDCRLAFVSHDSQGNTIGLKQNQLAIRHTPPDHPSSRHPLIFMTYEVGDSTFLPRLAHRYPAVFYPQIANLRLHITTRHRLPQPLISTIWPAVAPAKRSLPILGSLDVH